jgi:group I intron endonuclease
MIGIYKIISPSGKIYVGQSTNIHKRFDQYQKGSGKKQTRLYRSFQKYGILTHIFEIVEECKESKINLQERYWQEYYNVIGKNGLNCKLVNVDGKPARLSDETKKLIGKRSGEARKGKPLSELHKESIKEGVRTSNKFKEAIQSEQRCIKISVKLKGRKLSEDHIHSLKAAQKRRFETTPGPMLGKTHSQESRDKMKGPKTKTHIQKNKEAHTRYRNIGCYTKFGEFVKHYDTVTDAVLEGFLHGGITSCIKGLRGSHRGYIWKLEK